MTSNGGSQLLSRQQVAERLGVSIRTVQRWTQRGLLPAQVLPSGRRRYLAADVDAAVQQFKPSDDQDQTEDDAEPAHARGAARVADDDREAHRRQEVAAARGAA